MSVTLVELVAEVSPQTRSEEQEVGKPSNLTQHLGLLRGDMHG